VTFPMASAHGEIKPEAIDKDYAPKRAPAVHTVEIDGEAVLLNKERLHLLNATGALLWACFDGVGTITAIAADVSEVLGVPYETVLEDTLAVVRSLGDEGLLESVIPTTAADAASAASDAPGDDATAKWRSDPRFIVEPPNT
jgi:hypothetical protein